MQCFFVTPECGRVHTTIEVVFAITGDGVGGYFLSKDEEDGFLYSHGSVTMIRCPGATATVAQNQRCRGGCRILLFRSLPLPPILRSKDFKLKALGPDLLARL